MADDKPRECFIIMPFGGYFESYHEEIFRPAIETAGLTPRRADDMYAPRPIVGDIWQLTRSAEVVLADLTGKNPNVLYELGLAHAIRKPVVMVTEDMDDVPFDLRALRVLEYDKNEHNWGDGLRNDIAKALGEVLESPERSIPPTFIEAKADPNRLDVTEHQKELLELRNEFSQQIELLRREMHSRSGDLGVGLFGQIGKAHMVYQPQTTEQSYYGLTTPSSTIPAATAETEHDPSES